MSGRAPVLGWTGEFVRFGVVGAVGFVVNVATVYAIRRIIGLYAAGLVAWVIAATVTWALNRAWTFRGRGASPMHRQWARFLTANFVGFVLYYVTYVVVITYGPFAFQPVLAIFAGMIAGTASNFALSRNFVFR